MNGQVDVRSAYAECAGREVHYMDWRPPQPARATVVAWHGLVRTGRDMDDLAAHLAGRGYRVLCPDTPGRGLSEWSSAPQTDYAMASYAQVAVALVDGLGIDTLHWVGTSMGGSLGMILAGGALAGRIRRLVVNDIGPELPGAAIERILAYVGSPPVVDRVSGLEAYFRNVYAPFGTLTDAQWRRLTETSVRRTPEGKVTPHYDPRVVMQFTHHPGDQAVWADYDRIVAPTLVVRGEHSDLLTEDVALEMRKRGPRAIVATIRGCGHAPALNVPAQLQLVTDFLDAADGIPP